MENLTEERLKRTERLLGYFLDGASDELLNDVKDVFDGFHTIQQQNAHLEEELSNAKEAGRIVAELHDQFQQQNKQMKEALESAKAYLKSSPSWNEKKYRVFYAIEQSIQGGSSNDPNE